LLVDEGRKKRKDDLLHLSCGRGEAGGGGKVKKNSQGRRVYLMKARSFSFFDENIRNRARGAGVHISLKDVEKGQCSIQSPVVYIIEEKGGGFVKGREISIF